jgi:L-ascorbate metabolism protein UlaG (beta-lactamase superfamily)
MGNSRRLLVLLLAGYLGCAAAQAQQDDGTLTIEKLTWAGIKMTDGNTTVFIDAIGTDIWDGNAPGGLVPVEADTPRTYALITHVHNDHFDVDTLKEALGERGYVICHESVATYVASRGLRVIPVANWTPVRRGGFLFTPVPAADGFGAEQVSWIVAWGGRKYLHAGDTLWHGKFDLIGAQYGPFDTAFLPINGARVQGDPMQETPAVLTPDQAVDAAVLLRADRVVPIHYGGHAPPGYLEVPHPLEDFLESATRRNVAVERLSPGDRLSD